MANRSPPPSSFRTKRPFALTGAHEHLPEFGRRYEIGHILVAYGRSEAMAKLS